MKVSLQRYLSQGLRLQLQGLHHLLPNSSNSSFDQWSSSETPALANPTFCPDSPAMSSTLTANPPSVLNLQPVPSRSMLRPSKLRFGTQLGRNATVPSRQHTIEELWEHY